MKEVTGQNLSMFRTKLCGTVLGQVDNLETLNQIEDKIDSTRNRKRQEIMLKRNNVSWLDSYIYITYTLPFKSLESSRQFRVFHENSLLFIK